MLTEKTMSIKQKTLAVIILAATMFVNCPVFAGNQDRSGQAGASELLINPGQEVQVGQMPILQAAAV